jgi:hypothetical protein
MLIKDRGSDYVLSKKGISNLMIGAAVWLLLSLVMVTAPVLSQNGGSARVVQAVQQAQLACAQTGLNEACYAHDQVGITFAEGAAAAPFEQPGDVAGLVGVQTIKTAPAAGDLWGVALVRMLADLPDEGDSALTMALLGDAQLANAGIAPDELVTCTVTNRNQTEIPVFAGPSTNQTSIGTLAPLAKVTANGRNQAGDWLRIDRGGTLAWVPTGNVAIDCEAEKLLVGTANDLHVLYTQPMQAFTLENGTTTTDDEALNGLLVQSPTGKRARLLVNGVQIVSSGAMFMTASPDDILTIYGLEGQITVRASGKSVVVRPDFFVTVPLAALAANGAPSDPQPVTDTGNRHDLLNSLIYGQAYNGPDSTIPGLTVTSGVPTAAVRDLVRIDMQFTGDAGACETTAATTPLDVVLLVDTSGSIPEESLASARGALANFIRRLNPDLDRVSVIGFDSRARVISALGEDFDVAIDNLEDLRVGGATAIEVGLTAAYAQIKGSQREDAASTIILISDGLTFSPELSRPIAVEIRNSNIRLFGVGLNPIQEGQQFLLNIVNPGDYLVARGAGNLRAVMEQAQSRLTRTIAARDLTLTYTLDTDAYEVDDQLLSISGGALKEDGVVEWQVAEVRDTEAVNFPLIVRPVATSEAPVGSVQVSYLPCAVGDNRYTSNSVGAPQLAIVDQLAAGAVDSSDRGILEAGETATGTLKPFGEQTWALNTPDTQNVTIKIEGAQDFISPVLLDPVIGSVDPLYTLYDPVAVSSVSVFKLPGGAASLLSLQSGSENASGEYSVTVDTTFFGEPVARLVPDAAPLSGQQVVGEGQLYGIDAAEGDVLTFRMVTPEEEAAPFDSPFRIVSLDGAVADDIYTEFIASNNEWVTLRRMRGSGPYYALLTTFAPYTLAVDGADTLTNPRGEIAIDDLPRTQDAKNDNPEVFTYTVTVPAEQRISIRLTGSATSTVLRDSSSQTVPVTNAFSVGEFTVEVYDLQADTYTIFVPVEGEFGISVVSGDVTTTLKRSISFDATLEENLPGDERLGVYNLVEGSRKPLREGDQLTVSVLVDTDTQRQSPAITVQSSNGLSALPTVDYTDTQRGRQIVVFSLQGEGPYRILVTGANEYTLTVNRGDLLSANKGALVLGQTVRDSSRTEAVLYYTVSPELGKALNEGDIVTISFTNQAGTDNAFFTPFLEDVKENEIIPQIAYTFGRQFVGVYELEGRPPYRLVIPNIGSYVLSFNIGDRLTLDQGEIAIGQELTGTTTGSQIINYTLGDNATPGTTFTVTIEDDRSRRTGSSFDVHLFDGENNEIDYQWIIAPSGATRHVYTLSGSGPYRMTFQMDGGYTIRLEEGDKLTIDRGRFFVGDAETNEVDQTLGLQVVRYQLDLTAGQVITTNLSSQRGYFFSWLYDPERTLINPVYELRAGQRWAVYQIAQTGTYELTFTMERQYTLRVTEDDQLTLHKGNVYFGVEETDALPAAKLYATYTINAPEGQFISVEYTAASRRSSLGSILVTDANGDQIFDTTSSIYGGYQVYIYELAGPGPYTMTLAPRDAYLLRVTDGDILRIPKGNLSPNQEVLDTALPLPDPLPRGTVVLPKRVLYTLAGMEGQAVTIEFGIPKNDSVIYRIDLTNADGASQNYNAFTGYNSRTRSYSLSYTLVGPGPYTLAVDVVGQYRLVLNPGDALTAQLGALPYGETVENRLEDPLVTAVYTVPGAAGDIISLQLERTGFPELTDSNGNFVLIQDQVSSRSSDVYVYQLPDTGPFQLRFTPDQRYKVTLASGNTLIAELGALTINRASDLANEDYDPVAAEGRRLDAPAVYANYTFEADENSVVTLELTQRGGPLDLLVADANGFYISPEAEVVDRDVAIASYRLSGPGPYMVSFSVGNQYSLLLSEGDRVHYDAGVIPTGTLEDPYTNELPEPARIAVHTLDVAPGDLVTIQLENSRRVVASELRDGNGKLLEPEFFDFQDNANNISVYILSGSGPYTLSFPVDGEYTAIVNTANLLRVDKGIVPFDSPVEDELNDPGRVATYLVDGKREQTVSIQLQASRRPIDGEFRDANGRLWLPEIQVTQSNALYNVYVLGGPGPYDITFAADRDYNITVSDGNVLRAELGEIPVGEAVRETLDAPAQTAIYTLRRDPGNQISIQLQVGGRAAPAEVYDANGQLLRPEAQAERNNAAFSVYTLTGPAPYRLEFNAPRQYNITVTEGNVLRSEQGCIGELGTTADQECTPLSERISKSLPAPAQVAIYDVHVAPTENFLSVGLQIGGRVAPSTLYDSTGAQLEPGATIEKSNTTYTIYTLTGNAPYRLEFEALRQYTLTTWEGNILRADQGVIRFGNTITAQLTEPAETAFYTIDGLEGQVISIQLADRGRPADSQLRDANNNLILPWGQVRTTSATFSVYTLSGPAPYKLSFVPNGRYSLTLTEGNFFRAELRVIPFGQTANNRLPVPATTAIYTLNTESDQVISAQIVNRAGREFIEATLFNANGDEIEPQTTIFDGNNTSTFVYTLTGTAPYRFEFDVTGNYSITFTRGDVSNPEFDEVGPQSDIQTRP